MPNQTEEQDDEQRRRQHWALDLKVNVGHLLTTLALAVAVFTWGSKMDTRVSVLEERSQSQMATDIKQDQQVQASTLLLRSDLAGMRTEIAETNRKIDRILETMNGRQR